jgi:hypothetical protein
MMDLLVQVTTLNKISTGGHVLQAIGEQGILPYKPSTPIGALDTWTIQVVPKLKGQTSTLQKKTPLKPLNQQQPFEQTFRLQVCILRSSRQKNFAFGLLGLDTVLVLLPSFLTDLTLQFSGS